MNPDQPEFEINDDLAFETALDKLETIVADLERGQPVLASALAKYETGLRLLNHCHAMLDHAERNIAILTGVDPDGEPRTSPFDAPATDMKKNS